MVLKLNKNYHHNENYFEFCIFKFTMFWILNFLINDSKEQILRHFKPWNLNRRFDSGNFTKPWNSKTFALFMNHKERGGEWENFFSFTLIVDISFYNTSNHPSTPSPIDFPKKSKSPITQSPVFSSRNRRLKPWKTFHKRPPSITQTLSKHRIDKFQHWTWLSSYA